MKVMNWMGATLLLAGVVLGDTLPQLDEKPFTGQYVGFQKRSKAFWIRTDGVAFIGQAPERGRALSDRYSLKIEPVVEEIQANGRASFRKRVDSGFESFSPATQEPEKVTYRGTVTGGAKFEVQMEFDGDEVRVGGRLVERGTLKQPRFTLRIQVGDLYYNDRDPEKLAAKVKKDRLAVVRVDGKKFKYEMVEPVAMASHEGVRGGVKEAELEMVGFRGLNFEFKADEGTVMEMWNGVGDEAKPLSKGFSFNWRADAEKDPEGKARVSIVAK